MRADYHASKARSPDHDDAICLGGRVWDRHIATFSTLGINIVGMRFRKTQSAVLSQQSLRISVQPRTKDLTGSLSRTPLVDKHKQGLLIGLGTRYLYWRAFGYVWVASDKTNIRLGQHTLSSTYVLHIDSWLNPSQLRPTEHRPVPTSNPGPSAPCPPLFQNQADKVFTLATRQAIQ